MKKAVLTVVLLAFISFGTVFAVTDVYTKEKQLGIDLFYESDELVYTPPTWFKPVALANAPEDINHWLYDVLPYPEDRDEDVYLVIPQLGLVTPVVDIPSGTADYTRMINGQDFAINNYLKGGIIEYVGSVAPGYRGKRIDFGHSNYYKSDDGRYKSIFANLMAVDPGDEVWYYVRQPGDRYRLFKYTVTKSYPTNPGNVSALSRDGEGADALIFGCYHGLDGRWLVEATYQGPALGAPEDIRYASLPLAWRNRTKDAVSKVGWMPRHLKAYQIVMLFRWTKNARSRVAANDPQRAQKLLMLDYIEERLAIVYPEPG